MGTLKPTLFSIHILIYLYIFLVSILTGLSWALPFWTVLEDKNHHHQAAQRSRHSGIPPFLWGYTGERQISYKDSTTLLSLCITTQPKIWTRLFISKSTFSHLQHACVNAKLRWVLEILKVKYTGFCFCRVAAIVRWPGVWVDACMIVRERENGRVCMLVSLCVDHAQKRYEKRSHWKITFACQEVFTVYFVNSLILLRNEFIF